MQRLNLLLSLLFLFVCLEEAKSQQAIKHDVPVCKEDCITIGEAAVKKYRYQWIFKEEVMEPTTSEIEICKVNNGDVYILRIEDKKGKFLGMHRYKMKHLNKTIKIGPIDNCVSEGKPATVEVIGNFKTIKWSTGEISNSIVVQNDEPISVDVVDENNCASSRIINVKEEASNSIRNRLLKEGFQAKEIKIISKKKKKN